MDVQVQVAGQITSKPTNTGGLKFDVPLNNGMKPSTFDAALVTKVSQFGGQVFTARIGEKPNPRGGAPYLNLLAVAGPGEALPPEIPQAGTPIGGLAVGSVTFPPSTGTGVSTPTPIVAGTNGNGSKKFTEADTIRITKLSALSTATQLVSSLYHGAGPEVLEEAIQHVEALAKHFYSKSRDHEAGVQTEAAPVVAAEPQAVAAFVAEQAGTAVVQVGTDSVRPSDGAAQPAALPWS